MLAGSVQQMKRESQAAAHQHELNLRSALAAEEHHRQQGELLSRCTQTSVSEEQNCLCTSCTIKCVRCGNWIATFGVGGEFNERFKRNMGYYIDCNEIYGMKQGPDHSSLTYVPGQRSMPKSSKQRCSKRQESWQSHKQHWHLYELDRLWKNRSYRYLLHSLK